ncbi:MAG: hypothetical protein ACYS9X_29670, partial [Planctomycetota bacterium]
EGRADARSEIYAVGLVIYWMLARKRPEGRFPLPSELGFAPWWDRVVEKTLAPEPDRRYASAAELLEELENPRERVKVAARPRAESKVPPPLPYPPVPVARPRSSTRWRYDPEVHFRRTFTAFARCYWIGLVFCVTIIGLPIGVPLLIAAVVYSATLVYRAWGIMQDKGARVTPGTAVGLCFIPVFGSFWTFVALVGLAREMNAYMDRHDIGTERISYPLAIACCVLALPGLNIPVLLAWIIVFYIVMSQIVETSVDLLRDERAGEVVEAEVVRLPRMLEAPPELRGEGPRRGKT